MTSFDAPNIFGYTIPMNENHNGGKMEQKVSTDPKTVKMVRRLERFLDTKGFADA